MRNIIRTLGICLTAGLALGLAACGPEESSDKGQAAAPKSAASAPLKEVTVAVSIYAGWMPHYYANEAGIYKKWGEKYGYDVKVKYMDYVASIEAYMAGEADAVVMTNMEALDMPAAAGVDTTVVVMGDYSNGNDAVLVRNGLTCEQVAGKKVYLVEKTVSHYLLGRMLESCGLKESDVTLVNVSDSDIAPSFLANTSQEVVVTWNPMVMEIQKAPGITNIFDSSKIPGEIQDVLAVNSKVLSANPDFARALTGAWYEVMDVMNTPGAEAKAAKTQMAQLAGTNLTEYEGQLATTAMFYTAGDALTYLTSPELKAKMDSVRQFCFTHDLLGENAKSADVVGIQFPDGSVLGDSTNIKLRYDATFTQEYLDGKISLK